MNNIQIHVMSQYEQLSKAEQKVADYFMAHTDEIYSLPIAELAERSGVSSGTWVRFCKSLGFKGLKELKQALFDHATEGQRSASAGTGFVFTDIKDHKGTQQIIDAIQAGSVQAIENTLQILDPKVLEAAAAAVMQARTIKIFGAGASSIVGRDLSFKLTRIGLNAMFQSDYHIQLTSAATMGPEDLAIIISNTGLTKEMLEIAELAREHGVRTLAITSIGKNPLAQKADIVLGTSSPETYLRSGAMSSRIAQLVIVDSLFTTLANKNYDQIEPNLERSYEVSLPHRQVL